MRLPRLSVLDLMAIVLLTCFLLGAVMRVGSSHSAFRALHVMAFVLTVGLLSTAVLGVAYRRGQQRAFWAGVLAFGWSSLIIGMLGFLATRQIRALHILAGVPLFGFIGGVVARSFADLHHPEG